MRVHSLKIKNFLVHKNTEIIFPDKGLVLIRGQNGSGKSLIIEAIAYSLAGTFLRSRGTYHGKNWQLEVVTSNPEHKIERGTRTAYNGQSVLPSRLTELCSQNIAPLNVWRRACVLSSQDIAAFSAAGDTDRKSILEACLGIDSLNKAYDLTKDKLNDLSGKRIVLEQQLHRMQSNAGFVKDRLKVQCDTLLEAESESNRAKLELDSAEIAFKELGFSLEKETLNQLMARDAVLKLAEDKKRVELQLNEFSERKCLSCGTILSASASENLLNEARLEAAEISKALRSSSIVYADVGVRVNSIKQHAISLGNIIEELKKCIWTEDSLAVMAVDIVELKKTLEDLRNEYKATKSKKTELDREIAKLTSAKSMFSPSGIPAYITANALTDISANANRFLRKLGGNLSVELKATTTLKSHETRNKIDIVVHGGGDGDYDKCSGGQRRRIDAAIMLGINLLASNLLGSGSTLFLDEVFDTLDTDGVDAFAQVIQELAEDRCVVLISHRELPLTSSYNYLVEDGLVKQI